jgi:hypothetical protein
MMLRPVCCCNPCVVLRLFAAVLRCEAGFCEFQSALVLPHPKMYHLFPNDRSQPLSTELECVRSELPGPPHYGAI